MPNKKPKPLFDIPTETETEWEGMPEFSHQDKTSFQSVKVHFACIKDRKRFAKLIKQNITNKTRSIWFPKVVIETCMDKVYADGEEDSDES